MEEKDSEKTSTDDGLSSHGLNPTSGDSGISNNEEFSLVSGGTSDYSLLETPETKGSYEDEKGKQKPSQIATDDTKAIQKEFNESNSTGHVSSGHNGVEDTKPTENISGHKGVKDTKPTGNISGHNGVKDKTRRESRTSSTNDFSIIDLPEDNDLDARDIEEDSVGKNITENLKLFSFGHMENKDPCRSSTGQLISMNRPKDSNGHQSSELGSSFAVLDASGMSSSYPSSFDKEIDRTKVHVLPPKNSDDSQISTSVDKDGQKVEKKKNIQGGIVEVDVQREDWKTDGTPNSIDTTDNAAQKGGNREESKDVNVKVQSNLNSHTQVDPTLQKTDDSITLENKHTQNAPDTTNVASINNNSEAVGKSLSEETECSDKIMEHGNLKKRQNDVEEVESQVTQQTVEVISDAMKNRSTEPDDEPDFSVVDEPVDYTNKVSKHFGKSDIDSDIPSSHFTSPRSRSSTSTSSESIEINMSEPELSDDSNGHNGQKSSSYSGTETSTGCGNQNVSNLSCNLESEQSGVLGTDQVSSVGTHKVEENKESLYNRKDKNMTDKSFDNCSFPFRDEREKEIENEKPEENAADYNGSNHPPDLLKETLDEKKGNVHSSSMNTKKTEDFSLVQSDVDEDGEKKCKIHPDNGEATGTSSENDTESNKKDVTESEPGKKTYDGNVTDLSFVRVDMPEMDNKCSRPDEPINGDLKEEKLYDEEKLAVRSKDERLGDEVQNNEQMSEDNVGKRGSVSRDSCGSISSEASTTGSSSPDVWQLGDGDKLLTEEEAVVYESLRRTHGIKLIRNYQCSSKHKSHEAQIEHLEIPVKNELVYFKWRYVLAREEKIQAILKEQFSGTRFSYDESFERIELIRYEMTETEEEAQQWSKNVMNEIENQVRKINSYLICCSGEDIEMIMLQMEKFHTSHNLDICIEHCLHPESNIERLIVIGQPTEVASVLLQLDPNIVKIFEAEENSVVSIDLLNIPLDDVQHDVFLRFEGPKSMKTNFPNIHLELSEKSMQLLIQTKYVKNFSSFMTENWLKFKHRTKILMKPQEFTLLCKASVRDYIVNDKLKMLGLDYRWSFMPEEGDIILFTENLGQLDEIRDAIFGSFTEHTINLENEPSFGDIRKMEKWTEIVDDVKNQSNGMADIAINDMQTCVTIIGTDDLMEAWLKFGNLASMKKYIDENIKPTIKASPSLFDDQKLVKKFVQIDSDRLDTFNKQTMDKMHNIASNLKVELVHTDRGFEVKGLDESKVKNMCDHLLGFNIKDHDKQNREAVIKRFVQMDESQIEQVCQQKVQCMRNYSKELNIEYDPTNLGFEVKGTTEANVKKFCDYLLELKNEVISAEREISDNGNKMDGDTELKLVKRFVQMEEEEIDHLCNHELSDMNNFGKELNISFDPTNLGFEVKGKTEDNVKKFCDRLIELKTRIIYQDDSSTTDETTKENHVGITPPKVTEELLDLPLNIPRKFTQLDERVIHYIDKFKIVEIKEIMANLDVEFTKSSLGFEIYGEKKANVQTLDDHLMRLNSQIEIRKVENVPDLTDDDLQRMEEKYKCIIKILSDKEEDFKQLVEADLADEAVWCVNGIKVSVAMRDADSLTCDVIVIPMVEEISGKKFVYQEKYQCEEVQVAIPLYKEELGKEKHDLTQLLVDLLFDLNSHQYNTVALPVKTFNKWPSTKLTKIMLVALKEYLQKPDQNNIQKIYVCSTEPEVCQRAISAMEYAMPDLKRDGLTAVAIKKPRTDKHDHPSIQPADATPETEIHEVNTEDATPSPPVIQHIKDDIPKLQEEIKPKIIVIKDLIAKQKVDVIVNSTSPDFDLKNGAVSKSILDAAGKKIQKDVNKSSQDIVPGQIVATGGHKLHCKAVYHGNLQGYDKNAHPTEQRSVKILTSFVSGCLIKAHRKSYRSIAFPVLGAGALDFPPDVVASMMKKVVEDFGKKNEHTTIEEVRVVVFKDDGIFTIFRMMAEIYNKPTQVELYQEPVDQPSAVAAAKAPEPPKQDPTTLLKDLPTQGLSLALNRVTLSAGLGDVTKLEGFDCLILLWPQDEIKLTPVDKEVILKSVGKSSLTEWEKDKEILSGSKILVTPGGFLPQKTIIHVYVENLCLQDAFMLGLAKAEEMKMKSTVIPVRPTDSLAKDVGDFSACIYRAVTEMNNRLHIMRHVKICIGGKHLCQPILATLAKLQETGGQHFDQTKATCIVEITALKDDMENIMYEINPKAEAEDLNNRKDARMADEEDVKSKTLTKDDMEQFKHPSKRFLVNLCAEISPDVIQTALQTNQLEILKMGLERISEKVKISEVDGKWVVYGSYEQIEMCQSYLQVVTEDSTEPTDGEIIIKVDITKNLYQALLFLEKRKLSEITGNANLNFIDDAGLLEISGHTIPANVEKQIQELVSSFQANMIMDMVEVPYRLVQNSSVLNFILKLQIDHPDVYIYTNEGKGAESAFPVYLVSLKREDLASAKKSIQTEYLKTSTRAGRFTQSQTSDTNTKFGNPNKFNRSYSLEIRKPSHKTYKTEEGLVIHVYMGNILQLNVDCIVNAANSHLMHGGGIAAVIADAAGKAFNKESYEYVKRYGEVKTGHCCVTHAGNLPYKRVIHGVGPHWSKGKANECCDLLQKTIEQCIQTANAHQMTSIAIPSISAGLYGMPPELCAKSYAVGVMTVSDNRTGLWSLKEVHFVDNKPDMVFIVQKAFSDIFESSETRRQRSVEESLQTSVEQFKGDTAIIDKLKKNQSLTNAEEIVQRKATVKLNTQTESNNFTISQSPIDNYILPNSSDLPASWKVTIKTDLIEIETGPSMKVYLYESDFEKQIMESIAIGKDIDYGQRSTVVQSLRRRTNVKAKLDQLKIQIPKPTVGTVAMFEAVTDTYLQKVFVVFTPKYPRNETPVEDKKFHDNLYGCYLKIFQEVANTKDTEFLAVSFLKTGNRGTSFEEGVKVFLHAVDMFTINKTPECRLKQIHLIVNKDTNALQKIKLVLEQNFKDSGQLIHIDEKANKKIWRIVGCKKINSEMPRKEEVPSDVKNIVQKPDKKEDEPEEKSKPEDCAICLEEIQNDTKKTLHKCKHVFCKECIDECFRHRPVCPTCGMVYGIVRGTQPTGTMKVEHRPQFHLQGHKKHGSWVITYTFFSDKQTAEHPNPGKSYRGTSRTAYLPANEKGTMVMKLLKIAFDRKLVFTIGHSRTTGEENVVTWNDIHHKTSMGGGPQAFGYPDPEYLDRVLDELAAKGVTKEDLRD
ncbi:uncharacterized protein LOC127734517 [Mytilus californianus]|uniref:uncharacterized protein LOC127734517 n=1 Tax=Mytilus californianus TaxID=6549 RepID=UPI002247B60E|nr:uncharacterized protein LOC127734517 [Mytilus californianus]XP_052100379.1 uncharacterized protein LOC127734517 [Mytilus californianus]XP_052100380.1 uncharacterized protein LOC127734517 [Mytilus californianus]